MRPLVGWVSVAFFLGLLAGCGGVNGVRTAYNRGVYHQTQGRPDQAISEYRTALEDDPEDDRARYNLATALQDRAAARETEGDQDGARAALDEAEVLYLDLLARRPADTRSAINLAAIETATGRPEQGLQRLERLALERPGDPLAQAWLGARHLADGRPEAALQHLEAATRLDPGSLAGWYFLGQARRRLGDAPGAREAWNRALLRDDGDVATLLALAELSWADEGDPDEAVVWLRRARSILPEHPRTLVLAAEIHTARGDLEQAVEALWILRRLDPDAADRLGVESRLRALYASLLDASEGTEAVDGEARGTLIP